MNRLILNRLARAKTADGEIAQIKVGIGTGINIAWRGPSAPAIITATTEPSLGALEDEDTVQSAYTAGSYASSEGTIASAVETVTINGTSGALADVVSFEDVVSVSVLVTDSAGNTRAFTSVTQTVQGIAPTADTAPTISGATVGSTPSATAGTYSGVPNPTVLGAFTLDGAAFDPPTELQPADEGKTLAYVKEATNGITPDATQTVTETVVSASSFLLDTYSGAAGAWSLRQLSSSTTNVVRVRRSSDNAEQDFTATDVSDGTLETWVGATNDGFVVTKYDQSGNARHVTQSVAANQPRLVQNGSLITENGRPTIDYNIAATGAQLKHSGAIVSAQQARTVFVPFRQITTSPRSGAAYFGQQSGSYSAGDAWAMTSEYAVRVGSGNKLFTITENLSTSQLATFIHPASASNVTDTLAFKDGTSLSVTSETTRDLAATDLFGIGAYAFDEASFVGLIPEVIVYGSDQSANRAAIEQDIADYHGITLSTTAPTIIEFGANTLTGQGGYDIQRTDVTDFGGTGLELSGTKVIPSADGSVSDGTITFDNGDEMVVEAIPNAWSIDDINDLKNWASSASRVRGTDKALIRAGAPLNPTAARVDIDKSGDYQGSSGFVVITKHETEDMPVIRHIGLQNVSGPDTPDAWIHFDRINFEADITVSTDNTVNILMRSPSVITDGKVTNCKFGESRSEEKGDPIRWWRGVWSQNLTRRWDIIDNDFYQVDHAIERIRGSRITGNRIGRFSGDATQNVDAGNVISFNHFYDIRVPLRHEDITTAETSPANSAHTRINSPGHSARTNTGNIDTSDGSVWDTSVVFRTTDPALSQYTNKRYDIADATVDWIDVIVDTTGEDLSGFAGAEFELNSQHSDAIQSINLQAAQSGDAVIEDGYVGYDSVIVGNTAHLGTIPTPYNGQWQGILWQNQNDTLSNVLMAYNLFPACGFTGISVDTIRRVVLLNNTMISGLTNSGITFIDTVGQIIDADRSVYAGNITHDNRVSGRKNSFDNLEITAAQVPDNFVAPTFYPNQFSTPIEEAYEVVPTVASQGIGTAGLGLIDYDARTFSLRPHMVDLSIVENSGSAGWTVSLHCVDPFATLYYLISSNLSANYTNSDIENATLGGDILEIGTMTKAQADAGYSVAEGISDGTQWSIHIAAINAVPAAQTVDPVSVANVEQQAIDWVNAVNAEQGTPLPDGVFDALNKYLTNARNTSSRTTTSNLEEHVQMMLFIGPDTLATALGNPVIGVAPTNVGGNFTESDYDPAVGLTGDGTTTDLDTNVADTNAPMGKDQFAFLAYLGTRVDNETILANNTGSFGATWFRRLSSTKLGSRSQTNGNIEVVVTDTVAEGVYGWGRNTSSALRWVTPTEDGTASQLSQQTQTQTLHLFSQPGGSDHGSDTIAAYVLGGSINMTTMKPHLDTLVSEIRAALTP